MQQCRGDEPAPRRDPLSGHILIVDDDPGIRALVSRVLADEGWATEEAADGDRALDLARTRTPDLVVLDLVLPPNGGLAVLAELRMLSRLNGNEEIPVILLTGRAAEEDRIRGLDLGADDYVVKPFSPGELAARVRSILRRTQRSTPAGQVEFADGLTIDAEAHEVSVRGELVELTAKEFDLLSFLAASPRRVYSRGQLLEHVWDSSSAWQDEATVTEHIRRLRRKIETDPDQPRWLRTVRGAGYRFEP